MTSAFIIQSVADGGVRESQEAACISFFNTAIYTLEKYLIWLIITTVMLFGRISGQHDSQLTNCQMRWRCGASCSQMSGWHIRDSSVRRVLGCQSPKQLKPIRMSQQIFPAKSPQKWLPCLARKPKCSNRAKDWRTANKQQQQQKLHKTKQKYAWVMQVLTV